MDNSAKQTVSEQLDSDRDHSIEETGACIAKEVVSDPESNALPSTTVALVELPRQFENLKIVESKNDYGHKDVAVQNELLLLERSEFESSEITKKDAQSEESRCISEPFKNPPTKLLFGTCVKLHGPTETSTGSIESISGPSRSSTSCQPRPSNTLSESPSTLSDSSSTLTGSSNTLSGSSSPLSGSSCPMSEPSSCQPEPSSTEPGPSCSQLGPIYSLPQLTGSRRGRDKTRHRRSKRRLVAFVRVHGQLITINPSEGGTSTASSGSNLPISEVVPISLRTEHLCAEDKAIINKYNIGFRRVVRKVWKYRRAAKDTKKFVLECKLNFLRLSKNNRHLRGSQEQFYTVLSHLENINTDLAKITSKAVRHINSCFEIVSLLNEMDKSFSLPPQSPEFFDLSFSLKARNYLRKLSESMSLVFDLIQQAKLRLEMHLSC